jgi:hypothetical protein
MLDEKYPRAEIARKQRDWVRENSWAAQARRIGNLMRGCFEDRHGVELRAPHAAATEEEGKKGASPTVGNSLREMIEAEFLALSTRDFISFAFRRTLGREPTSDEIRSCEDLRADPATAAGRWRILGRISKLNRAPAKLESFRSEVCDVTTLLDLDNRAFIDASYRALLLREPDSAERESYLTSLENGTLSKRQVIGALLSSEEFRRLGRPLRVLYGTDLLSPEGSADGTTSPPPAAEGPRDAMRA